MKRQILFIHGAQSFSKYDAFLEHLRTVPIDDPLGEKVQKRWQSSLRELLLDTHEVYTPTMPNKQNARYIEWKLWFERYFCYLRDGVILIGHSQGGYFLAKYLSENTFPVQIGALYLLAAPFESDDFGGEDGGDFAFEPKNLGNLTAQVNAVYVFHSMDDPIVAFSHAEKYSRALSVVKRIDFSDKNHFLLPEFPELIHHLRQLDA